MKGSSRLHIDRPALDDRHRVGRRLHRDIDTAQLQRYAVIRTAVAIVADAAVTADAVIIALSLFLL